jgi:Chalcone isomerase-like
MSPRGALSRRQCLLLVATPWCVGSGTALAAATPPELSSELDGARLRGSARLRFLGLSVYEARLWSAAPVAATSWAAAPLALEIQYARSLAGHRIAERSLEEMRRQGEIAVTAAERWLGAMKAVFPDVQEGDRITGVFRPGEGLRFFFNGVLKGEVRDPEFARLFVGIWLSPRSSEPAMREALMGAAR